MNTDLQRARDCYDRRAWSDAFLAFTAVDESFGLEAEDLECLALSAYLVGRDAEYLGALERAHESHLRAGRPLRSARCAFWLGLRLLFRGESGRATGWLTRAERLTAEHPRCAERGYLLLPAAEQHLQAGDCEQAHALATTAARIGESCGEQDLLACARHLQGRALIRQGQVARGLPLLDEAMVAATGDHLSPLFTGLIYCSVIEACQEIRAVARAREWTSALSQWCEKQPEMLAFSGICYVHRAEILQLQGFWQEAMQEAQRACERCLRAANRAAAASAYYQLAEVRRLRGEFALAEEAFRAASEAGREPQPGLALMRAAQGNTQAAVAAIRRVVGTPGDPFERMKVLPAAVEILSAAGQIEAARAACAELEIIARKYETDVLKATANDARARVDLAEGNALAALSSARPAWNVWQRIGAPYLAARTRAVMGMACRALGDEEGATLEFDAARAVFERLEAAPDLEILASPESRNARSSSSHGLTPREVQVLRLVASGKTNRHIASELYLSEKTVDRHVSNIFGKLGVPSRAAATAYAFRHNLV